MIEKSGGRAVAIGDDLCQVANIKQVFRKIDKIYKRIDVLVNNAGIYDSSPIESIDEGTFDEVISVNVKATVFSTKEAAKRMAAGGRIVNVSSSRAHFPGIGTTAYAGSKAMVEMLTRVWAAELGTKGITVNAVAPGPTSPGMFDSAPNFMKAAVKKSSPFNRIGTANEIAHVVCFLCSEEARWVTGQVVLVNGAGTF